MKKKPVLFALLALAVAAVAAGGYSWWRSTQRTALIRASLPTAPDTKDMHPILRERLAEAQASAQSGKAAGLAELATVYHANGYFEEASRCYEALEILQSKEPRWFHLHASILAGYGQVDPAIELWQRTVELAPDYLAARLRLADSLLKNNQLSEAAAAYEAVLKRQPDEPYATLGLGRIDLEQGRLDAARVRLERAFEKSNSQLGYDLIVSVYERLGMNDRAAAIRGAKSAYGSFRDPADPWIDALMEDCYDPFRISLGAGMMDRNGDFAGAVRMLERALQLAPKDVSARFQLAGLYLQHGDAAAARKHYQQCTVIDPEFSDGWIRLSSLLEESGDMKAAEQAVLAGLAHSPDSPGLHLLRGRQLKKMGRKDEAIPSFEASIRYRPNEPEAYLELAFIYLERDEKAKGTEQLLRALDAAPANPAPLTILAYQAISSRDRSEADRWLEHIARQPRVPKEMAAQLYQSYRATFGTAWEPKERASR